LDQALIDVKSPAKRRAFFAFVGCKSPVPNHAQTRPARIGARVLAQGSRFGAMA
jgi:hypothetical protein